MDSFNECNVLAMECRALVTKLLESFRDTEEKVRLFYTNKICLKVLS
jgi:hypothetical protein